MTYSVAGVFNPKQTNQPMNGKRALSDQEYLSIRTYLHRRQRYRDLLMVSLGYHTGYRIKEVLSVRFSDVYYEDGTVKKSLTVQPRNMKRNRPRPAILITERLREDLKAYYLHCLKGSDTFKDYYLIQSQKGGNKPISYTQAYRILMDVFDAKDITENVACHSLRKSFCQRYYEKSNHDIRLTQYIMGHSQVSTTERYIGVNKEKATEILKQM